MSAEHDDPMSDAEHRGLIQRLRALPPEGDEPDWSAMERAIREAVGDAVPRPWWRRWTAILPATTFVTAMAVLLLVLWGRGARVVEAPLAVPAHAPAPASGHPAEPDAAGGNVVTLWLDGAEVEVDTAPVAEAPDDDASDDGLLPGSDLAWVDRLDDAALDRAERWLDARQEIPARKKG
jgi:hypothetical protein